MLSFDKMHGLGNDFAIFDLRDAIAPEFTGAQVAALGDRQRGIGFDQMIVIGRSERADIAMQIYNQDGSKVGACGNASRCVVALMGRDVTIETDTGILSGQLLDNRVRVDMGKPGLSWQEIPLGYAIDTLHMPVAWDSFTDPAAVSMGNPHVIAFYDSPEAVNDLDLASLGAEIEHDPLFPEKVNVNAAAVKNGAITLRLWERGAGLTLACGTGACATAVAAIRRKLVRSPVKVHLPGGMLEIDWHQGGNVTMTGGVCHVYQGQIAL